jgi:small-conductance mechanosensitive channel
VRHFQVILGKLVGVLVLDVFLVVIFATMIYSITVLTPRFSSASQEEITKANDEFFTARKHITPPEPEVEQQAIETYRKLKQAGELDQLLEKMSPNQILQQIKNRQKLWARSVQPGREISWDFRNVQVTDLNKELFVEFKYSVARNPAGSQVYGQWIIGDYRPLKKGQRPETPVYELKRKDPVDTLRELKVPADAIANDGFLGITFLNPTLNDTVVIFPLDGGLKLLYKADTFTSNFFRCVILIMISLIFLACLGFLAASFLSFPVAILLCLVVFFGGSISGFILVSFNYLGQTTGTLYFYTVKPLVLLLPRLDQLSVSQFIVPGKLLTWGFLGTAATVLVGVKSLILLGLALLIFTYREIAKIVI